MIQAALLPLLIGHGRAAECLLTGESITARQALDWGLVNEVYPAARFDEEVAALAGRLAEGPTRSYAVTKLLLNQSALGDRLDVHLDRELDELNRIADTRDFAEGLDAFFDKRPPRFQAK